MDFLGQPGDLVAASTALKITQRLRLDAHKLEDLERKLRTSVVTALEMSGNKSQSNQVTIANQTKFALLLASPKTPTTNGTTKPNQPIKTESSSPDGIEEIKQETIEEEDQPDLSRLIDYLNE